MWYIVSSGLLSATKSSGDNVDTLVHTAPLSFARGGVYSWNRGALSSRQNNGYYWVSRADSALGSRYLSFGSAYVNPWTGNHKGYGNVVRCVARITKSSGDNVDTLVHTAPLSFVRGGYYPWNDGHLNYRRQRGYYWSSRTSSATSSRHLNLYFTYVGPRSGASKGCGFVVRCVASISAGENGLISDKLRPLERNQV